MDATLFGRDMEIRAGRAFLDGGPAQALVVQGPAGIGKTAVWRSLIEIARADGYLVLESIGDSAEARLTFVGLADLLGTVADEALPHLPAPQAHALEVALLRVEAAASPGEPRAVAVGVLSALRALAARRSLERAASTFDEIGSTGWAARARSEIDRIGARRPGRTDELTPTERRVVELAAAGRSNKEIARALFVTLNTVEGHLSHAYAKLGIHSRAQLAHRLGGGGVREGSREH